MQDVKRRDIDFRHLKIVGLREVKVYLARGGVPNPASVVAAFTIQYDFAAELLRCAADDAWIESYNAENEKWRKYYLEQPPK